MPDFVDEILDAFFLCIVSSGFFTRRISAVFVAYRQFRILYTTDLGNSGYLDLHSEPVQREGEGQNPTLHAKFFSRTHDTQRSNTLSLSNGAENIIGNFTQLSLDTKKYRTRGT